MPGGEPEDVPLPAAVDAALPATTTEPRPDGAAGAPPRADELLRGQVFTVRTPIGLSPARARLTSPTLVAVGLLVLSVGASLTFVLARGGIALPTALPSRGPAAEASPAMSASSAPSAPSSPAPLVPEPTAGAGAMSSPGPTEAPTAAPAPTSDRYAVLVACAGSITCWTYTIRRGDNLVSIANWFGVPLATIYEMNPGLRTRPIRAGMQIRLPAPTR